MPGYFDNFPNRRPTNSVKWKAFDEDVLPMWVADMDFLSPPAVIEALQQRVAHGIFGYTYEPQELRELLVERLDRLYQWKVQPEAIVFMPGVINGFNLACRMISLENPDSQVIVQPPVYPPFLVAAEHNGLQRMDIPLVDDGHGYYEIDFQAFEAALNPAARLFILCNPHNPVGRVFTQEELTRLAEICLRHNITICSDEIHCDLIFSGQRHIPIASLSPEIANQTITLMAPSKTFNIAGLESSYAIIPNPEMRAAYQKAKAGLNGHINLLGVTATIAAYRDGQEWLTELLTYLESNRDLLANFVNQNLPGLKMASPQGTYLAWIDCRESNIPGNPQKFFLDQARVALNHGVDFGLGGEGFVRLNFGCPRNLLEEGLQRMRAALLEID